MSYNRKDLLDAENDVGYIAGHLEVDGQTRYNAAAGQYLRLLSEVKEVELDGATVTLTSFIPKGCFLFGVSVRVSKAITGATGFQVGDGSDADLWGDVTGTAVGTVAKGSSYTTATNATGYRAAAGNVVLTAKTSDFTDGKAVVAIYFARIAE